MDGTLPSLNGLRAFEAAARHLSIKDAAAELFVTPAAVSQQIKNLEDSLETPLLIRRTRAIELTDAGSTLYPVLRDAFRQIEEVTDSLRHPQRQIVTVTVLPSLAARWLVPRLGSFKRVHPEVDVRISAELRPVDLNAERIDLGIRFGMGEYPGLKSEWLMEEELFPVCSPSLLEKGAPLERPEDLAHHTLLHDDSALRWQLWKEAMGLQAIRGQAHMTFNDASLVLDAAIAGQGVALARRALVENDLRSGRLIRLWDSAVAHDLAYYLVYPERNLRRPATAAFRQWLMEEAGVFQGKDNTETEPDS